MPDEDEAPPDWLRRTRLLLGSDAVARLAGARVTVIGLGAVGSFAVEGLARSGVGCLRLVDFDVVHTTNLNRQLYAARSTIGLAKTTVAAARVRDINPSANVEEFQIFAHRESLDEILSNTPDLVIDAIDSLAPKVELIAAAAGRGIPVFSALGAATRLDADGICFGRLMDSTGCPLGRLIRKRLRRRGIDGDLWSVYSTEPARAGAAAEREEEEADAGAEQEYVRGRRRSELGSMATVTGLFGLRLAHEAVRRLAGW